MAFTQSDVDALKKAIATGARAVVYQSGEERSEVQYKSLAEMRTALAMIEAEATPAAKPLRATFVRFERDF